MRATPRPPVALPVEPSTVGDERSRSPRTRRQRFLAAPPGVVLAACMFLPAIQSCGSPLHPVELPPVCVPYVLGALVAAMAWSRRLGRLRALTTAVIATAGATAGTTGIVFVATGDGWGLLWGGPLVLCALLLLASDLRARSTEERAALGVLFTGLACAIWFGPWAFDRSALIGVRVSLGASVAMIIAGAEWWREAVQVLPEPVPRVRVRSG